MRATIFPMNNSSVISTSLSILSLTPSLSLEASPFFHEGRWRSFFGGAIVNRFPPDSSQLRNDKEF